jgi:hypothetical protein
MSFYLVNSCLGHGARCAWRTSCASALPWSTHRRCIQQTSKYLDSNSYSVFPGSAGVSPAQQAARMAALPGYKLQEHHGIHMMSGYLIATMLRAVTRGARPSGLPVQSSEGQRPEHNIMGDPPAPREIQSSRRRRARRSWYDRRSARAEDHSGRRRPAGRGPRLQGPADLRASPAPFAL